MTPAFLLCLELRPMMYTKSDPSAGPGGFLLAQLSLLGQYIDLWLPDFNQVTLQGEVIKSAESRIMHRCRKPN